MTLLRTFSDGTLLEFGEGRFDAWCVYVTRPGQERYAPKDTEYFAQLQALGARRGARMLYDDFVAVYHRATREASPHMFEMIYYMSRFYGDDALEADLLLSILLAGMVAEENKARAKLRKRIKRLGVYQLLIEGYTPEAAATFSRGKKWNVIELECVARGF